MRGEEQQVKKAMDAVSRGISPAFQKEVMNVLQSLFKTGVLPKEALGFNNQKIEVIYSQAYRLYNTGKYVEASHLFRLLLVLDPTEAKYGLGLAACLHLLKEYQNAIQAYTLVGIIDGGSPLPHFHASDCYLQMGDKASAVISLEMAVKRAGEKAEYQVLKDRSLLTIEGLKKEILAELSA